MGAPGQGALRPPGPPGLRPLCRLRGTGPCDLSIGGGGTPDILLFKGPSPALERPAGPLSQGGGRPGLRHRLKARQTAVFHGFAIGVRLGREIFKKMGQPERGQAARLVHRRASVPCSDGGGQTTAPPARAAVHRQGGRRGCPRPQRATGSVRRSTLEVCSEFCSLNILFVSLFIC